MLYSPQSLRVSSQDTAHTLAPEVPYQAGGAAASAATASATHPHYHLRPRRWNGCRVEGPPQAAPHQALRPRAPPSYPPPLPPPPPPPPAGPPPYGPARNNLGDPEPPRRRLEYPGGGAGGGELPQCDNGPAGEPGGRGRRAPGGAWGQLPEKVRDELTRPLRVESGRTNESRTIERPRGRARALDRRELAPPPREGRRGDPMPPPSPEESGMGSPEAESSGAGRQRGRDGGGAAAEKG